MTMVISFVWIVFLFLSANIILNRRLPIITVIGQNTLPIFLMHGFVVKTIGTFFPYFLSNPFKVFLTAILIVLFFGNKFWGKLFSLLFTHPFFLRKQ